MVIGVSSSIGAVMSGWFVRKYYITKIEENNNPKMTDAFKQAVDGIESSLNDKN